jgi:hypothetical protein
MWIMFLGFVSLFGAFLSGLVMWHFFGFLFPNWKSGVDNDIAT